MLIREIMFKDEMEQIVQIHMKRLDWLCADYKTCLSQVSAARSRKAYIRVLVNEDTRGKGSGEVLGYIYGNPTPSLYTPFKWFSQQMCWTNEPGLRGVRIIRMLHDDMFKYAEDNGFPIVSTSCSHLDEDLKFVKVLERFGWERRGYMAVKVTKHWAKAIEGVSHLF
jgi:hypothetical protein